MSMGRGTGNLDEDPRWGHKKNKSKQMKGMTFPASFKIKVNIAKVNMDVINKWVQDKLLEILGIEDDILEGTVTNLLEAGGSSLDPRELQLQLTPFLAKKGAPFVSELWDLLIDAQKSAGGIPTAFIEKKKEEFLSCK